MGDMAHNGTASSVVIGEHNSQCSIDTVESATAMLTLWGNIIAGVLGAIAAPLWGKASDSYGRIRPLAAASTVMLASETIVVLIAKLPDALSLNWIYLAYLLEGLRWVVVAALLDPTDSVIVGHSYLSWRLRRHMRPTAQMIAEGMSPLVGFTAACSLGSLLDQCLEDILA